MIKVTPIAHAAKDQFGIWREPHLLNEHLLEVAKLAQQFATSFNGGDWAYLSGLWHDLGKYRPRFQHYIRKVSGFEENAHIGDDAGKAPHSTAGAIHAGNLFGREGRVLAYLIAGHHAGLSDWDSENSNLSYRLAQSDGLSEYKESMAEQPPAEILALDANKPDLKKIPGGKNGFALWVRMLFSCLIDADRLDTEAYTDEGKALERGKWPSIQTLHEQFTSFIDEKTNQAVPSKVNKIRASVLNDCKIKAIDSPGLFSLTVPTGGGKTLSSLAFALMHARHHEKRRIIYVIPYTSIIEQTVDVFRSIFGDAVVEHHSNAEADSNKDNAKSHLATENWDAPIIVTTNVQFFESLFAARTSRCRKLHNIVNSVVVLDEAQLLPPEFLQPILDVLNLLTAHYGVTVVLSTATQPAFSTKNYFDAQNNIRGLNNVREIISDPDYLYESLNRVEVELPKDWNQGKSFDELSQEIAQHESVLAIVSRRKDARELWERMPSGTLHLSALMCGQHRSNVIQQIKARLKEGIPTRVISTQLVEAGVDVDFPIVYRAIAGLDSIAQAAGRCNREGKLDKGKVIVFVGPQPSPVGLLRKAEDACRSILYHQSEHPLARSRFASYFEKLYYACDLDANGINKLLEVDGKTLAVNFRKAAEKFKLIANENSAAVIVRYKEKADLNDSDSPEIEKWLNTLKRDGPDRWIMRKLQRYTVNISKKDVERLLAQGDIEELFPGLYGQVSDLLYHDQLGLVTEGLLPTTPALIA